MKTYLLTWNPLRWEWEDLADDILKVRSGAGLVARWSCGVTKSIQLGDYVYLMKLGTSPKGIVASGVVTREMFEAEHWDPAKARSGIQGRFIEFKVDTLLNPFEDSILLSEVLNERFPEMEWHPQASGTRIPDHITEHLARAWLAYTLNTDQLLAEEVTFQETYFEGAISRITINAFERNSQARRQCISHYGATCCVCGFNFFDFFGEIGQGFIHVHHLVPISNIDERYKIDPVRDLRPVCPNCHSMLHRREPPFSIGELKAILDNQSR